MEEDESSPSSSLNLHFALTHILTNPTTTPTLSSQLLLSTLLPSIPLHPPFLSFLLPSPSSFRAKCPFLQPPPPILADGVERAPERWTKEERRRRGRERLRRGRVGIVVPTLVGILVPNVLVLSLLLWDPRKIVIGYRLP